MKMSLWTQLMRKVRRFTFLHCFGAKLWKERPSAMACVHHANQKKFQLFSSWKETWLCKSLFMKSLLLISPPFPPFPPFPLLLFSPLLSRLHLWLDDSKMPREKSLPLFHVYSLFSAEKDFFHFPNNCFRMTSDENLPSRNHHIHRLN